MATLTAIEVDLPNHLQLPSRDGKPVDNSLQPRQRMILTSSIYPWLVLQHPDNAFYIGEDVGIYWKHTKMPLEGCKAPDWFYVPGVPKLLDGIARLSYVMWQEGVSPLMVTEFISRDGADEHDRTPQTGKFWVYEQGIRAPYYIIHSFESDEPEVFGLVRSRYKKIAANKHGRYPIPEMGVQLGVLEGPHLDYTTNWLRFWDGDGNLLLHAEERSAKMAEKLRKLGVDPDAL